MRADLPCNNAGIPPEAREAARAAARREGLSVGEWLTRRILRSLVDQEPTLDAAVSEDWAEPADERPQRRREVGEALARPLRDEFDAEDACRRIEDDLRAVTRRLDATERSQSDSHRAANKAATEMSVASREHARAVDELSSNVRDLSHRIERVERHAPGEGLRDAVRGLHQGLTRLADQLSQASTHATDQISALTDRLEDVSARLGQTKLETDTVARRL